MVDRGGDMPVFTYKVRSPQGSTISGTIEANDLRQAVDRLRAHRFIILEINEQKESALQGLIEKLNIFKTKIKAKDIVLFSRQLSTMISAGVPIAQGLSIMAEQIENPAFKKIVEKVRDDIEAGSSIADAMAKHPHAFNSLYVNMIRAGELGGVLDIILERLSSYLESSEKLKGKVKSAMVYPAVVLTFAIGISIFLLTVVIPTFQNIFSSFGAELPLPTKIMIGVSNFLRSNILFVIGIPVVLFVGIKQFYKTEFGRAKIDTFLLKLPMFGILFKKVAIAKFTRTFGVLIKSGVPILQAMETVARTSGNWVIEDAVLKARESIREGERITEPLASCGVFPPMVIQMIRVGEETGNLDAMLTKIADFYDQEVDVAVASLASMIEPIVIVFMGLLVGSIVISMFLPMFQLSSIVTKGA